MKVLIDVVFAVVYYCCGAFFYSWPSSQLDQLDQALAEGEQPQLPGNDLADAIKVTILSIRVLFVVENILLSPLPPLFVCFSLLFFFFFFHYLLFGCLVCPPWGFCPRTSMQPGNRKTQCILSVWAII